MSFERVKIVWKIACDTPGQKLVLMAIADAERDEIGCWPSISKLSELCSMSRQGVLNQIAALEKKGWIAVDRKARKSSVYRLTIPVHAMDYSPEKKHAFQSVHAVDQSTQLTSPRNGLVPVHAVDQSQSTLLTTPVHSMDCNYNEPEVEPEDEPLFSSEAEEQPSEPVLVFSCVGTPKTWALSEEKIEEWKETYPQTDVVACCKQALQWTRDKQKKTAGGMPRFLNAWITRATNKGENRLSESSKILPFWTSPHAENYTSNLREKFKAAMEKPLP